MTKDVGILDLQLRSNQRMSGSHQRRAEQGCHVELRENCTTSQSNITLGTNGMSDDPFIFRLYFNSLEMLNVFDVSLF